MDLENALSHLKELSESHGAKCYLDAFDTISKELAEALKPSHNKQSTPLHVCECGEWERGGGVYCSSCGGIRPE